MIRDFYETERLWLMACKEKYAPEVLGYYQRNRDFLKPYESARVKEFYTEAYQRRFLAAEEKRALEGSAARFFLALPERPGEVVGLAALSNILLGSFRSAFLAYNLDEACGGQGLMNEALRKVIEIAFGELGLHRLEANILPRNTRSLNVVKRLGFANEGVARDYFEIDGRWEDHVHMVLLNDKIPPPGGER
ncbi:GNAT family N-acetyltransferase [Ruminococcaceae bacterium OttesenSCG-928-I18]|nr:GNAT family N-acetyltransferase [Ruminococcaceae bacterium OttesenSCG-928-I18]